MAKEMVYRKLLQESLDSKNITKEDAEKNLLITQKHDEIKTRYCKEKNLPLVRIPYWENKDIKSFLIQKLEQYKINL